MHDNNQTNTINPTNKVSVNILSSHNIEKIEVDGKRIIAITVPYNK